LFGQNSSIAPRALSEVELPSTARNKLFARDELFSHVGSLPGLAAAAFSRATLDLLFVSTTARQQEAGIVFIADSPATTRDSARIADDVSASAGNLSQSFDQLARELAIAWSPRRPGCDPS
jgi:hypothetical protein